MTTENDFQATPEQKTISVKIIDKSLEPFPYRDVKTYTIKNGVISFVTCNDEQVTTNAEFFVTEHVK